MTFNPENDLERALQRAMAEPALRAEFYRQLLDSNLFVIGQIGLTQGELLQEQEPAAASAPESNFPEAAPRPLPAT